MVTTLKRRLYFTLAAYFRIWASIKLHRWAPKIIVVTGSAGKTTLLHLIEAQLGKEAHYSHHANSAYGIPFDILGLEQIHQSRWDWFGLFIKAPFRALTPTYAQKMYVVEVDADRPKEAQFLANLLHPDITLWVSSLHTHTDKFDEVVGDGHFKRPEEAIAYEYGNLLAKTKEHVILNGDSKLVKLQVKRTKAGVEEVSLDDLAKYSVSFTETTFEFNEKTYSVPGIQPRAVYYQIAFVDRLMTLLGKQPDVAYRAFIPPPGRTSVLKGVRGTTIIDSTYNNSNFDSLKTVVDMFDTLSADHKWLVLGDLLEQGKNEAREHAKIADLLVGKHFERVLLVGKRISQQTAPLLPDAFKQASRVGIFAHPAELRDYLLEQLKGGEAILFKGAGFLEGVIEVLLADQDDKAKLVRQDGMQQRRRKDFGL